MLLSFKGARWRTVGLLVLACVCLGACAPVAAPQPAVPVETVAPVVVTEEAAEETVAGAPAVLEGNILEGSVEHYDPDLDYFPDKVSLQYAEVFEVTYYPNYKVVTVLEPWRDADVTFRYVLVQRGTPAPEDVGDAQVIEVPVATVAALSTTHLYYLVELGLLDRLTGVGGAEYISTPGVSERIEAGQIVAVGRNDDVNLERMADLAPELITTLGLGMSSKDNHPQLLEAGFDVALVADFMETTPLGRAEWIKFMALFFNREAAAEQIFADKAARYEAMTALTQGLDERPTVFMGFDMKGTWYMPGGGGYLARYLEDAGATYLWEDDDSTGKISLDFEAVYDRASDADYWVNLSQSWVSLDDALAMDERYAGFAAVQQGHVYNNNARLNADGGNDYNQSGHANPDLVLADLIKIFHPELLPEHELQYYRHLVPVGEQ